MQREEGATDVDPYAKGALWVQMIEKAYASLGGSYTSSEGGTGGGAFEALTGGASTIRRQGTDMKSVNARMAKTPWPDELPGQSFLVDDEEVEKAMAEKRILYQTVLGGKAGTWQSFVEKKVNHDKLRHLSSLEAVQEFLTQQRVDGSIVEAVMGYLESEHVFSGKLGSGKYDDRALEVFAGITQARASNKPVTAGTEKTLGTAEGRGDSGGEDKVKGLAGGHEYTVLATKEDGGLKWVQVRNPWGKYGAAYRKNEDDSLTREAIQEGDGVSWIELSDFMNDFNSVSST